jgi:long-chain acyl-CoA synthetase
MESTGRDKGDTWPKVLKHNYEKYGDGRKAMRHKRFGIWQSYTWKDYYLNVKSLALGLASLGFEPGDRLLIIGDNAPEWYYAELAAQSLHGASVGLYADSIPSEIREIAQNSEARFAIVENQEQVDKMLLIKDALPLLKMIIYWSYKGLAHYKDPVLIGYRQVLQQGEKYEGEHPGLFEQRVEKGKADDVCAIVYTSGTTGAPKGALHTHGTMRASADYYLRLNPWRENDNLVPYLPPAWMTEQCLNIGCHLLTANILNFAEAPETQQRDTRETAPSIVFYGARLWESQAAMVQARIIGTEGAKRFAVRLLMPIGYKMADLRLQKKKPGLFQRLVYLLADIALFRSIRSSLGLSHARICCSTGGILSPDAFRFYRALNLPLKSVYGTTEGGVLTGAADDDIRLETVGPANRDAKLKVTDAGEIAYRQPGLFTGYYKDPERTAEVLKDGWFYSGDSGFIREDGHIVFLDRVRELVLLASGDKLAPQFVEARLRSSPYIKDAWVLAGPRSAYPSAIIVINYDTVSRWAGQRRVPYSTFAELAQKAEVYDLVKQDIDRVNSALPSGSRIKKYVNLYKELDPDDGELTRTRKLRKRFLEERYSGLIDAIYGDETEVPVEARATYRDGRIGTVKITLRIKSIEGAAS